MHPTQPYQNDGLALTYREWGDGPSLLLLAGGPGMSSDYMVPLAKQLAIRHRVILPDQRATRTSERPPIVPKHFSMDRYVSDVEALRKHLKIDTWSVVGHSWGGWLAQGVAVESPSRIANLVLVGSCGPSLSFLNEAFEVLRSRLTPDDRRRAEVALLIADQDEAASENARASMPAFFHNRSLGERYRDSQSGLITTAGVFSAAMQAMTASGIDLGRGLGHISAPAMVIHGDYDHIPLRFAKEIADCIPRATLEVVTDCGHFPWVEQPQAFQKLLDRICS